MAANNAEKLLGLCDFRSFSSTPIDRGIGIRRFGVEKATFDFVKGAQAKNHSVPENRDASILVREPYGFSDRFRSF